MSGQVLDYEAKRIRNEAREEGMLKFRRQHKKSLAHFFEVNAIVSVFQSKCNEGR